MRDSAQLGLLKLSQLRNTEIIKTNFKLGANFFAT